LKKLIIGTAQLVNNYGVANQNDKKTKKKILEFLEFCFKNNLKCFDTAFNYGSEKIIGEFIKKNYIKNVKINSKIPSLKLLNSAKKLDFIKKNLDNSLNNLNLNTLDTVYFHDENDKDFFISNIFEIKEIFKKYKIKNLGFSIYSKKIFKDLNKNEHVNSIQVPVNIINKDFCNFKSNKKIVARSIFLQGLLINSNIKTNKTFLKDFNKKLANLAIKKKIDLYSLCLNYVLQKKEIHKIIIGFDNVSQLNQMLNFRRNYSNISHKVKLIDSLVSSKYYNKIKDPRKW